MSALTQAPFRVADIRKGRSQPGLKNQHLHGIKALKKLCNAKAKGDVFGSSYLEFVPGKINAKNMNVDIGTAGSITLILQSLLLPLLFADRKSVLTIKGGTDTKWSPQLDYIKNVFLPQIGGFGGFKIELKRRGYYPKGNGEVIVEIDPKFSLGDIKDKIGKINLSEQGDLARIGGISHASDELSNAKVAERQMNSAREMIESHYSAETNLKAEYYNASSIGSGIALWAEFSNGNIIGADSLGERGKKAELVGKDAAKLLVEEIKSGAAIDGHMADQIIPFIALSGGMVKTSCITKHCLTNIYVVEKFLGKILRVDANEGTIENRD